jgi:hypothetical protein
MTDFSTRGKGYLPIPEGRALDNWHLHPLALAAVAPSGHADLRPFRPRTTDQGRIRACTGHGYTGSVSTTLAKAGTPVPMLSPSSAYKLGRCMARADGIRGTATQLPPLEDRGANPDDVHRAAAIYGIAQALYIEGVDVPCDELTASGEKHVLDEPLLIEMQHSNMLRLVGHERVWSTGQDRLDDVCRALDAGFAVEISVYASDARYQGYVGGVMPPPPSGVWCDHWNYLVGYETDATGTRIYFGVNSWGEQWGERDVIGGGTYRACPQIILASDCLMVASVRRA